MDDTSKTVIVFALLGSLITIAFRYHQKNRRGWKSTVQVLYNDYTFEEYATLNLLSLIYAVVIGGLTGAGIGFAIRSPFADAVSTISASAVCFLIIPIARVFTESYTIIYKTAKDASTFFAISSREILKNDPSLQEKSAWLKEETSVKRRF